VTLPAPTYDLVLLLDTQAEDVARAKILADARSSIEQRGELLRDDDWGERPLAYPIRRRKSAEYHLFQFHAADTGLLSGLDRTLRITDGVIRFRLIKLRPGVPDPPDMRATAAGARRPEGEAPAPPAVDEPPAAPAVDAPPRPEAAAESGPAELEPSAADGAASSSATEAAAAEPAVAPSETPAASEPDQQGEQDTGGAGDVPDEA
jgi:small subunit ribosomal protein S6